jgi:hypothetical protein
MLDGRWIVGFLVAWMLFFMVTAEMRLGMVRMLMPIIMLMFLGYLFTATLMYLFQKDEKEPEEEKEKSDDTAAGQ